MGARKNLRNLSCCRVSPYGTYVCLSDRVKVTLSRLTRGKLISADPTMTQWTTAIPKTIQSGHYLLRMEHIGLHSTGDPQWYISCAQLSVSGGGSASPATVEIP